MYNLEILSLNRLVFVAFRILICEPGCKQVFPSPVIHVKYYLHTYIHTYMNPIS